MVAASLVSLSSRAFSAAAVVWISRSRGANSVRIPSMASLACGASAISRAVLTTPILISAVAVDATNSPSAAVDNRKGMLRFTTGPLDLERLSDRELELFLLVGENHAVSVGRIQRESVADAEQAQRGKPLHRYACRPAEAIRTGFVGDRRQAVPAAELHVITGREHVAHIKEQADPGAALEFLRHRQYQLRPGHHQHVAAIGIAVIVLGPEPALAEPADRIRTAGKEQPVRRQRGRPAQRIAVRSLEVHHARQPPPDRYVLHELVVEDPVFHRAARDAGGKRERLALPAVGEQAAVQALHPPSGRRLDSRVLAAEELV